jgi:hypothetical protein
MRLMVRDIELPDTEGEVDGVEIVERGGQVREVKRQERGGEQERNPARAQKASYTGRSCRPSFRLPER